ncbi:unnamed protein product [Effrenium voratum]|uniref:Uncharacterized protein n=1 Tax=Effrenium voratum TaxID=2562239 RepID=A0AA36JDX9_9DINO|nr:unnamed protein product [Effrenium voratum]CAJ1453381.1 unnamed protein product [Effrenium voratum]
MDGLNLIGSKILASNDALSFYTERARIDDRYVRWAAPGNEPFLQRLTRRGSRYVARGFPHSKHNKSEEMWSTFREGHASCQWQGTTRVTMEEGFQPLVPDAERKAPKPATPRKARIDLAAPSCITTSSRGSTRASPAESAAGEGDVASDLAPSAKSGSSLSQCTYVRRLETLRRVSERPPVAGPVKSLEWDMFTAQRRGTFEGEPTGQRAIHPTIIPGAKPERRKRKEDSEQ